MAEGGGPVGQNERPSPAQDDKGRFQTGNSGGGRPKGSRNKLGEAFVSDLFADWQEHGADTIEAVREKDPVAYLKVVASLLPRELKIDAERFADLSDDELDERLRKLERELRAAGMFPDVGDVPPPTGETIQ